jgi:hypothetical protein
MESELVAEFVRLGVPREDLPKQAPALPAAGARLAGPELARHLHGPVRLAMALRTQKRAVAGMGGVLYMGLDYARLDKEARELRLPLGRRRRQVWFRHFQVCETEMLRVWNTRLAEVANPGAGQ